MLKHFVENPDRLIDRDELMRVVWPDVIVSDDSVAQCIGEIRRVIDGDGQHYLRTVQRRGYRFAGPVHRVASTEQHGSVASAPALQPRARQPRGPRTPR